MENLQWELKLKSLTMLEKAKDTSVKQLNQIESVFGHQHKINILVTNKSNFNWIKPHIQRLVLQYMIIVSNDLLQKTVSLWCDSNEFHHLLLLHVIFTSGKLLGMSVLNTSRLKYFVYLIKWTRFIQRKSKLQLITKVRLYVVNINDNINVPTWM